MSRHSDRFHFKKGGFYIGYGNRQLQEEIMGNFVLLFIILYWVAVHIL